VLAVPTDVTDAKAIAALFAAVKEKWAGWMCCSTTRG